ncbi:MAG: 50S ribosomal protein L25/general stress protein Ctc [Pseudomonadota bacterium]
MADTDVFYCEVREGVGTGAARAARREGWVPGVLYGGGGEPVAIRLRNNEVNKAFNAGRMRAHLAKIDVPGEDGLQDVIARDVQTHPVKDYPIHVDLLRVDETTRINVEIPVRFLNDEDSPGLKRGGVLNVVRYAVEVYAPATAIPEYLEADIGALDIGDVLHISAFDLPKGVVPVISDRDFTVATIAAPSAVRSAEGEDDAAAEGEDAAAEGGDAASE